jgi:hypothetical protein
MALQRFRGRARRDVTPDVVDQRRGRHRFACSAQQRGQQLAAHRPADMYDPPGNVANLERPQHAEPHGDIDTPAATGSKAAPVALQPHFNRTAPGLQPTRPTVASPDQRPEAEMWRMINKARAAAAMMFAANVVITSCSGSGSSGSSGSSQASSSAVVSPSSSSASQSSAPEPTTFTSETYGYTVTVPMGWTTTQAFEKWSGQEELDGTSVLVDRFGQPSVSRGMFAAAAPWKRGLTAYTTYLIAWQAHYHEQCPNRPNTKNPVTVGGQPGVLLAYNCGILINNVATVHDGVGYLFVFVDQGVASATNPTDHATFVKLLSSVQFPD